MHRSKYNKRYPISNKLHYLLAPMACAIIMIAPVIRFSSNFGIAIDAIGLFLLIICIFLLGNTRRVEYLDSLMITTIGYFLFLVFLSAIFVATDMAFQKAISILFGCIIFVITIFAFDKPPDIKPFSIIFISLSFVFTALSFQKGIDAVYEMRLLFSFNIAISIFSIYFLSLNTRWWKKIFLIFPLIPFIYWGTMTGNRSIFLISLLTISFHYLFFHHKPLKAILIFLPSVCVIGIIYWYFFSESVMVARILASPNVGLGREEIWSSSINGIFQTFPMGAGINESYKYLSEHFWSHNILLELLLEFGIFSAVSYTHLTLPTILLV